MHHGAVELPERAGIAGADHDHGRLRPFARLQMLDQAIAVDVGHHQVEDDDRVIGLVHHGDGVGAITGGVDGMAGALDDFRDQRTDGRFVVNHQHPRLRTHEPTA